MARFIIEVEEGVTECNDSCPFRDCGEMCHKHNWNSCNEVNCDHYNFATMRIKELEESQCEK